MIVEVLHRTLDVLQNSLVAAMRDRAPVNSKALRTVSILYPNMMDIGCISHFQDRVGTKCVTPAVISSQDEGCQDTTPLERFVKAAYTLEGDGDHVFIAYQKLEQLKAFIQVENYATLTAAVQELFPLNPTLQYQWYNYGFYQCLQPAFTYFLNTMTTDPIVSQSVALFKAARLFSPRYIKISRSTATNVDWLRVVPFLSSNDVIQSLKDELPDYIGKAYSTPDVLDDLIDTLPWWKATVQDLPCWAAAVHKMVLVQPSYASAAAEGTYISKHYRRPYRKELHRTN